MFRNAPFFHAKIGSLLLLAILAANLVAAPVPVAHAATQWYVLPSGNDANNCQAPTSACATIAGALSKAAPGDTINIAPGIYVETLTIGRESHTDIALDDPRVSRQHARLSYHQQRIWLTDLRSSNGTFVNGAPIQERALQPGDTLSFGGLEVTFEDTQQPASLGRGVSK